MEIENEVKSESIYDVLSAFGKEIHENEVHVSIIPAEQLNQYAGRDTTNALLYLNERHVVQISETDSRRYACLNEEFTHEADTVYLLDSETKDSFEEVEEYFEPEDILEYPSSLQKDEDSGQIEFLPDLEVETHDKDKMGRALLTFGEIHHREGYFPELNKYDVELIAGENLDAQLKKLAMLQILEVKRNRNGNTFYGLPEEPEHRERIRDFYRSVNFQNSGEITENT